MDQSLYHLECAQPFLSKQVRFLAVDGAFAKESFGSEARALN